MHHVLRYFKIMPVSFCNRVLRRLSWNTVSRTFRTDRIQTRALLFASTPEEVFRGNKHYVTASNRTNGLSTSKLAHGLLKRCCHDLEKLIEHLDAMRYSQGFQQQCLQEMRLAATTDPLFKAAIPSPLCEDIVVFEISHPPLLVGVPWSYYYCPLILGKCSSMVVVQTPRWVYDMFLCLIEAKVARAGTTDDFLNTDTIRQPCPLPSAEVLSGALVLWTSSRLDDLYRRFSVALTASALLA